MPTFMFVLDVDFLFTFVLKKYTLVDLIDIRAFIYIIVENVLQCLSCTSQIKSNTVDIKKKIQATIRLSNTSFLLTHVYIYCLQSDHKNQ